ncbi:SusC/RagA family TonB-linked outer membrane protein [Marinilongibacter aquaticus]|uniref:SusC/RagA family TonB-linked outer membrane protein n=1 Tax=Marinilongibacter aquaticus TaxID=2975157 RepID=UPI0021BDBAD8|nr:SusC/RagA family TonB-linked outer membrane protein [Marinilongibacter aquaticus]UBM57184.1 SusC/RagA family TonB-linked outer membrane protein [Marinilongibacter aquaticus]
MKKCLLNFLGQKKCRETSLFFLAFCFLTFQSLGQITGKVVDENNEPLAGVNVIEKGTPNGTSTDFEGKYLLNGVNRGATLVFSYIGFEAQEIALGNRTVLDVTLVPDAAALDQVVVTALGITREKKSLGYAVAEIGGESMNKVTQENVLNAMAGKAPGVVINSAGGSAGSSVSMIIRGASSLSGDNQPLFVIDGVPVQNSFAGNASQIGDRNVVDYGNAISDLNAADIANVSILKGAGASALYGSRAGNGVVVITTKKGQKNQKMKVSLNSSVVFDQPYRFLKFHSRFATGVTPFTEAQWKQLTGGPLIIDEGSAARLGPELDIGQYAVQWNSPLDENGNPIPTPLVSHPNNVQNFVRTGVTNTNNVSISGGNASSTFRASYTNMNNSGIVPGSDYFRNTLNLSGKYDVSKKLSFSTNVNIGRSNSNNVPANNRGANPLEWAYKVSPHIDILDLKDYWEVKDIQQKQVPDHDNPYFLAYAVDNSFFRDRVFGNVALDYKLTDDLTLNFAYALDRYNEERQTVIPYSYSRNAKGTYGMEELSRSERNASVLLSYAKYFKHISFSASAGGNLMHQYGSTISNSSKSGGLVVPGLYNLSNILPSNLNYSSSLREKSIQSVYGTASVGFKDMVFVDVTGRNDWSSTLPEANRSYFYPSVSTSTLLNNIFDMGNNVDLLKLRLGWGQVGNDTDPYRLEATLRNAGAWGDVTRLSTSSVLLTPDLKPEIITSIEVGSDVIFYRNKFRMSATYYYSENKNQILPLSLPESSGYSSKLINAGLVSSRGFEFSIGGNLIAKQNLDWSLDLNYSFNRTRIEELAEGINYYNFWTDAKGGAYTWVGQDIGDIYDRKLITVEDPNSAYYGWPVLDNSGSWQSEGGVDNLVKIGNYNPKFIIGMQTALRYKSFSLSASLDWRQGGDFVSQTYRYAESDWATQRQLDDIINPNTINGSIAEYLKSNAESLIVNQTTRVGGPTPASGGYEFEYEGIPVGSGVFNPGVIPQYDGDGNFIGYFENLGGEGTRYIPMADNYPWDFTKAATFDASFIKLREITLSYQLPNKISEAMRLDNLTLSLFSRNVVLWTKANIGIDPERAFQPEGNGYFKQGIERYNVTPLVFPVGVKLSTNF